MDGALPLPNTNSSLPLFNVLTHLTYLTSTSPRIREIMVTDGGLEHLVRMLHDFCLSTPSREPSTPLQPFASKLPSPSARSYPDPKGIR
jgi:hypothetical protein